MALAWAPRDGGPPGADRRLRPTQVEDCVGAVKNLYFTAAELAEIDRHAN